MLTTSEGTHEKNKSFQLSITVPVCQSVFSSVCRSIRQKLLLITRVRCAVGSRVISAGFREISIGRASVCKY